MDPNVNLNEFFDGARAAIREAGELGAKVSELRKERETAEEQLNYLKKKQSEQISSTVSKRRADIDRTYDGEIGKCDSRLRKVQSSRNRAKEQGIKARIEEETAELRTDIKAITSRIKADFKAEHVPAYCNTRLFNALYFPGDLGDILILIITFAIVFFVIPYGAFRLFFDGSTVALIIIYILDVILFGGIYIMISRHTVMIHTDVLRRANLSRRTIGLDRKKIAGIIRRIREDRNESYYDLAKYDDEIAHIRQQLADITMKKNEAVNTFDNVTKNIIADEIISGTAPAIDEARKKLDDVTARFNMTEAARKEKATELSDKYEVYLGREFMTCARIDRLQEIINHGTASSISEAIEEYYRQYDI